MCLLAFALDAHPDYRFLFAGNRDELHARPTAPAAFWTDQTDLLAGRDLEAGGTWLGITRTGRFAVVTNYREAPKTYGEAPRSRGLLVSEFLSSSQSAAEFCADIVASGGHYRGFCFVALDRSGLWYASNRDPLGYRSLPAGLYGLSNHRLDVPWPKLERAKAALREQIDKPVSTNALLDMLNDRTPLKHGGSSEDQAGPVDAYSAMFVAAPIFGTRCTTAVVIDAAGRIGFAERSFDAAGRVTGEQRYDFEAGE